MSRQKADYPADSLFRACHHQIAFIYIERRCIRQKRREIIIENKCTVVFWISRAIRTFISRAQVASRIVTRQILRSGLLDPPKPRPLRPMRRNQHPLACKWIEPAVWHFLQQRSIHTIHKPRRVASAFLSGSPSEDYQPSSPPTPRPATLHIYKCPDAAQLRIRTPPRLAAEIPLHAPHPRN